MDLDTQGDPHDTIADHADLKHSAVAPPVSEPEEAAGSATQPGDWGPTLALAAFGLAMVAQFYLLKLRSLKDAALLFSAALLLFFILIWRAGLSDRFREPAQTFARRTWSMIEMHSTRGVFIVLAFLLDLTAVRMLRAKPTNATRWDVFAIWVGAIVLFLAATLQFNLSGFRSRLRTLNLSSFREHWGMISLLIALTALAFALRYVALGRIPDIIDGDEGDLGQFAIRAMRGDMKDMFGTIYGYGTLYFFIIAVPLKIFGINSFGLRFMSALAGSLTVPVLFLLGRRLFDARVGFIAAALLAVSHYHLHFSRIIPSGNALDALFATTILYLFYRGLEDRDTNSLLLSAIIVGVSQYFFVGSRLIGVIIIGYVGMLFLFRRQIIMDNLGRLILFALLVLLVSGPMIRWALDRTDDYMARMNQTGIIQTGWLSHQAEATGRSVLLVLADQVRKAFLVFNYYPVTGFYNATIPVLDLVSGGVFILGLVYSLLNILDRRYFMLNIWFWSGVVIGGALVMNTEGGAYRILVVFPAVALLTAIGFSKLVEFGSRGIEDQRQVVLMFSTAFLVLVAFFNLRYYFFQYAPQCRYGDPNTAIAAVMGEYLAEVKPQYEAYFLGPPGTNIWAYHNLTFLSNGQEVVNLEQPLQSASDAPGGIQPKVFFVRPQRARDLQLVRERYPDGVTQELKRCGRLLATAYRIDSP